MAKTEPVYRCTYSVPFGDDSGDMITVVTYEDGGCSLTYTHPKTGTVGKLIAEEIEPHGQMIVIVNQPDSSPSG